MPSYLYRGGASWSEVSSSDLPASGVTAGTYGDATHVGAVTVNAEGIVTAAANVAITAGGGGGLISLFDQTLGVAAASIDTGAAGVAGGHGCLIIEILARGTGAFTNENMDMQFNGDTGANYDWAVMLNSAGAIAAFNGAADTRMALTNIAAASATANDVGVFSVTVPGYDQTTFNKQLAAVGGVAQAAGFSQGLCSGQWRSSAAITRVAIKPHSSAQFAAGSRMTIYGTQ